MKKTSFIMIMLLLLSPIVALAEEAELETPKTVQIIEVLEIIEAVAEPEATSTATTTETIIQEPEVITEPEPLLDVIVIYNNKLTIENITTLSEASEDSVEILDNLNTVVVSMTESRAEALDADPNITVVENQKIHLLGLGDTYATSTMQIKADLAHTRGLTGAGIKIAIFDTGIDYTHPDLTSHYEGGFDFVNNDNDPMDDNGHGTHVAGIIAGIAPSAQIYSLKVIGNDGNGYSSDIYRALNWAIENGIQVANHSYGTPLIDSTGSRIMTNAFNIASSNGVVNVVSAGNSGNCSNNDSVQWPARVSSVIAVGAVDQNNNHPCFSSTGPGVDVVAPGVNITSTAIGGRYASESGTSMATPFVTGAIALIKSNGSSANMENALTSTATDLGDIGRDNLYGYGLINVDSASGYTDPIVVAITKKKRSGGGGGSSKKKKIPVPNVASTTPIFLINSTITKATSTPILFKFTSDLNIDSNNNQVKELQKFLNSKGFTVSANGVGSYGFETKYFGQATKAALTRFQLSVGLPGTGYFGPMTRATIR